MSETEKKIDYRFKILYAIGAILVCCGHTSGGGISILSDWFPEGGVHIALFAFCSGYFYNKEAEERIDKYILKKIKKLIIPLYIYTFAYGVIVCFLGKFGFRIGGALNFHNLIVAPIIDGHQFAYNMGGWFIAPLFFTEIYNIIMRKILSFIKKDFPETLYFIVNLTVGIVGIQLASMGYHYDWWLIAVRTAYLIPFYGGAVFYRAVLEKYDKKIPSFWYFVVAFLIKFIITYHFGRMVGYTVSGCNTFTDGPVMPLIIGFLGIAVWLRIATILEPVIGRSKWINLIADNTYSIMMNQFMGYMLVKVIYGLISKIYEPFQNFDWVSFKTDIWYLYLPKGLGYSLIIYVVGGIMFSIFVQKAIDFCKKRVGEKLVVRKGCPKI